MGCSDADEDGYSDPTSQWTLNDGADAFPIQDTQWKDSDLDGYGDNPQPAYNADSCPTIFGTSTEDQFGCLDSDSDGWSNYGDTFQDDPTQWSDVDSDGYGDNPQPAKTPDDCPKMWGNSTITFLGCPDLDGDGWPDMLDSNPDNNLLWSDSDGDGFADQTGTELSDDCPEIFGISINDKLGCIDTDGDGWSDEGDYYPNDSSRYKQSYLPFILGLSVIILAAAGVTFFLVKRKE